ncbi:MAG: efflux transporter outer membrane subunit [Piscinibacter sp.]
MNGTALRLAVLTSALASVFWLAGCASPGAATAPRAVLEPAALGASASTADWPAPTWWSAWGDAQLDAIVAQALAASPTLASAGERVRVAQAAVDATGAAHQPQANLSVELSDQRFTENGLVPAPLAGTIHWNNSAQIGVGWELDLFGRQRAALDAAIGQSRAAQADAQAARVLLAGNVASAYFNLARLLENRRLAAESLQQREQILALVRQRIAAGLDTRVELRQAEGLIAQTQVEIEALDEAALRARHALAELAGQGPQAYATLAPTLAGVRSAALPATLPADLIGRRADLVAQRWRVDAAGKEIAVARAQFYPNVNLVAFVGLSSLGLDRFVEAGSRTFGAGPALHLPLFDGGRLRAQLDSKRADADAAIDAYNATLLRALREVADEVGSLQSLERQQRAQAEATGAADAAFDLAVQRYQAGLGNFLTVLTAQTNVLTQRRAAADLKARHLAAEVALARALGGGYHEA